MRKLIEVITADVQRIVLEASSWKLVTIPGKKFPVSTEQVGTLFTTGVVVIPDQEEV